MNTWEQLRAHNIRKGVLCRGDPAYGKYFEGRFYPAGALFPYQTDKKESPPELNP